VDITNLLKRLRLAEFITLVMTLVCQELWTYSASQADPFYTISFICLGLAIIPISIIPHKREGWKSISLYSFQAILYIIASSTGTFRLYGLIYTLLAAKLALLKNLRTSVAMVAFLFLGHAISQWEAFRVWRIHAHSFGRGTPHYATIVFFEVQIITACLFVVVVLLARAANAEQASRNKANRLAKEIEDMAVAVERGRIVRDLHDSVGHSLTSLNIQLELTSKLLEDESRKDEARQSLETSRKIGTGALGDLRRALKLIQDDDINLADAVDSITERIGKQGKISFDISIDDASLSTAARHNLLLVIKECLTNIQKHSAASLVQIRLATQSGKAELVVSDNGQGFKATGEGTGLGIKGMQERISSLGGTFDIRSNPGQGTKILINLPT